MHLKWRAERRFFERRDKAGFPAMRSETTLHHWTGAVHSLPGFNGAKTIEATAAQWQAEGRDSPEPTTCRADQRTRAGQIAYTLKHS